MRHEGPSREAEANIKETQWSQVRRPRGARAGLSAFPYLSPGPPPQSPERQQTEEVASGPPRTCWALRQCPDHSFSRRCAPPGGTPAAHLQGTEAAVQIVQPRGKDELLVGTTQDLERQDSRPNLQPSAPTHLLLPAPKGPGLSKPPWLCVQPRPVPWLRALGSCWVGLSGQRGMELGRS